MTITALASRWSVRKMASIKNLHIFFLTVGEKSAQESLDALKRETTIPYKLTIWYDSCGRGIDYNFHRMLRTYSDDVVMLTKNHSIARGLGYALLYLEGDYIMYVPCDNIVLPGYIDRFEAAIQNTPKMACAGSARIDGHPDYKFDFDMLVNSSVIRPDGVMLCSKEAVLDIGSISPSFGEYGYDNLEWLDRARTFGWNLVTCSNISKEINGMHEGRSMNPQLQDEIKRSTEIYLKIRDSKYQNFKWWDHRFREQQAELAGV